MSSTEMKDYDKHVMNPEDARDMLTTQEAYDYAKTQIAVDRFSMQEKELEEFMESLKAEALNESPPEARVISRYPDERYKYHERELIEQFMRYIDSTYGEHYSQNKFQATEFIIDAGHGSGFCIGNVMKYAQRYGRKGSREDARKDLLKVLHYALFQLYIHDYVEE